MFNELPYVAEVQNPVLKDIVKNGIVDKLSLQKCLLATGNLFKKERKKESIIQKQSIQDSLNMIVTDVKFNDAGVRCTLDLKIPSVMKKSNPIDVVYKDIAKFDTQNPIIGSLLTQIQTGKLTDQKINDFPRKILSVIDLEIAKKLKNLKDFNTRNDDDDDDDDNNNNPFSNPLQPLDDFDLSLYYPPSSSISNDGKEEKINKNLTLTQKLLLENKTPKTIGELEKIQPIFKKLFPNAGDVFNNKIKTDKNKIEMAIPNIQTIFKEINERKLPNELHFFRIVKTMTLELMRYKMLVY